MSLQLSVINNEDLITLSYEGKIIRIIGGV